MSGAESAGVRHGGRWFTSGQVETIRRTVQWLPRLNRTELAATVCEHLGWHSPSGKPQVRACGKLLEALEAQGLLALPSKQVQAPAPPRRPPRLTARSEAQAPVRGRLGDLAPVSVEPAVSREAIGLCNEYIERYHPLGYKQPFGYSLRYRVRSGTLDLGWLCLAGAAKALTVRDRWIGWSPAERLARLPWVVNNTRFLILPWVRVEHLASHVLGRIARRLAEDWQARWSYRPVLLETFVDPVHYAGTCYRAAGWQLLGETTGTGLVRPGHRYTTRPKRLFVKPLQRDFRACLCRVDGEDVA
jgi:hypothetical protein